MYDTPLTRPTTVGGLLGNVFRGTGQVAQAGGGVPLQNYLLGPRSLDMLAARRLSTPATTTIAPSPVGLLAPEMMSTQAPVGFDYISPAPQLTKVRDRLPQKASALDEIERQSALEPSLLGRIGGGIRSAGKELGGLFQGEEGQLRARELSKALMTGPTRVPVSFGQSLVEGLASGGEAVGAARAEQAKIDMALAKAAKEASGKEAADLKSGEAAREKAYAVVSSVDDAIDILDEHGGWAAGFGSWLKDIPTTPASRMKLALDTIKAQIGFKELQAMREASKTGGALGQVTVRELELLQRTIAAIEPELKPEDLKSNLKKVREVMMSIANGVQDPRTGEVRSIAESASSKSNSGDVVMVTTEDMGN